MSPDIVVGQQPVRHVYQDDCARLTVLSCVYPVTAPVHLSQFFSFYCIPLTTIKDADDTPLSRGERLSDARITFPQSDRTGDTETLQSLSDEAYTADFPQYYNEYQTSANQTAHLSILEKHISFIQLLRPWPFINRQHGQVPLVMPLEPRMG